MRCHGGLVALLVCSASVGQSRRIPTFAEGLGDSVGLALGKDHAVYLATRANIYLLRDTVGDGVAHEQKVLIRYESNARYPHNGLSGFAFDAEANLYFGLG